MAIPKVGDCCFGILDLKWGSLVCAVVTFCLSSVLWKIHMDVFYGYLLNVVHLLFILAFVGTILLIIGIVIDKPELSKLYVIAYGLLVVVAILLLILRIVFSNDKHDNTPAIITTVVTVCIVAYCVVVVNSFHHTI